MIYFETHATSTDNELGIASGHNDVDLSLVGQRQAREMGNRYASTPLDRVLCSGLRRAWRTAEIAFADCGIPIIRDERLRECSYGDWNGVCADVVERERSSRIHLPFPNGQSLSDVVHAVRGCLSDNNDARHLLIVGHRATYYALHHLLTGVALAEIVSWEWRWRPGWQFDAAALKRFTRDLPLT
jgi:broad specificity phosphatase PhoE